MVKTADWLLRERRRKKMAKARRLAKRGRKIRTGGGIRLGD